MKMLSSRIVLGVALAILFVGSVNAQIVLTVDYSNLSAVKFTATGANSASDWPTGSPSYYPIYDDGISLLGFFTGSVSTPNTGSGINGGTATSSTLYSSPNTTILFNTILAYNDADPNSTPGSDINLYNSGNVTQLAYSTGTAAFTGEAVFDLSGNSSYTNLFPALGTTGNVVVWNNSAVIGTWKIVGASAVPEPSTYATIAGLVVLGFAGYRRRHRRQL